MIEYEWIECFQCNGTGRDPDEWDGRCIGCNGHGERESDWSPENHDDDDDSA
jgi:DnaJ-class molecular chaperone